MGKTWNLVAQTSAAKIYWLLATLVTTTITARYLGPSGRGVYVVATSWVTAVTTMGYFSLSQVVVFLATGRNEEEWLPRVFGSLLAILATMALVGWTLIAVLYVSSGGGLFQHLTPVILVVAFASLPFMLWIENGNGILMALGKLHVLNISQIVGGTASLILTFVFVGLWKWGVVGGLGALAVSQGVIVCVTLGFIARRVPVLRFDRKAARELLTGGAKLHLNAIGTYLFTQANVLILNNYRSPKETAYYQLAVQLVTALQIIPMAVSTVAYSVVARIGPDAAWPQHRKLLGEVLLVVVLLGGIAYFVSPFVISFVFGKAFLPSVSLYRILLLSTIGATMSIVMACQWIARGFFLLTAILTLTVGGATVLANLLVVPHWGMYGAAWVSVGTYAVSIVGNGVMFLWVQRRWRRYVAASETPIA